MQIDARIRFNLGGSPTLGDLRMFAEKTKKLPDGCALTFDIVRGQRDSETVTIVVQGSSLLED